MLLNEFELTLDYKNDENIINNLRVENNITYSEASMLYYKLYWKEKCRNFRLETRCITSMYSLLFSPFKTQNEWKILIQCCDNVFDERVISSEGVIFTQVKIDYEGYSCLSIKNKKNYSLDLLMKGIKKITDIRNWNIDPFIKIKDKIISLDYSNIWTWKSVKNDYFEAKVICNHCVNNNSIYLIVSDLKGNIILNEKIITDLPDEWAYSKYLGDLIIKKNKVCLIDKKKKVLKSFII